MVSNKNIKADFFSPSPLHCTFLRYCYEIEEGVNKNIICDIEINCDSTFKTVMPYNAIELI